MFMQVMIKGTTFGEQEAHRVMGPAWRCASPIFYRRFDVYMVRPKDTDGYTVVAGDHSGKFIPHGDAEVVQ